jgi:hypothetical protein
MKSVSDSKRFVGLWTRYETVRQAEGLLSHSSLSPVVFQSGASLFTPATTCTAGQDLRISSRRSESISTAEISANRPCASGRHPRRVVPKEVLRPFLAITALRIHESRAVRCPRSSSGERGDFCITTHERAHPAATDSMAWAPCAAQEVGLCRRIGPIRGRLAIYISFLKTRHNRSVECGTRDAGLRIGPLRFEIVLRGGSEINRTVLHAGSALGDLAKIRPGVGHLSPARDPNWKRTAPSKMDAVGCAIHRFGRLSAT